MTDDAELPEADGADPWAAHLPGQELVPAYLASRFAAQYRVIVDVLIAEQDASLTGLSFEDVAAGVRERLAVLVGPDVAETLVREEQFHLDNRLDRLEKWQVVTRWQQPARTGEDFLRRRDRYQITPAAARLHAFWAEAADADDEAADLTLAPRAIRNRVEAFAGAIRQAQFADAATEFQVVTTLHQAMAKAARTWQRTLAHALSGSPDPAKQELLWNTLQSYVGAWGEQVDVHSPAIADLLDSLDGALTDDAWTACVRASLSDEAADDAVEAQVRRWRNTWSALQTWFGGAEGQARRLRRQLRDLVAPWARNMHILMDTGGAVTRRAELLRLAAAVERAPDDESAWRIWDTAVGAFSARHLLIAAGSADEHSLPWHSAPAAPVTGRFREQGARAAVGRRTKGADFRAGRQAARRVRAAAVASRAEAEATLAMRSGTRVATWGQMAGAELDLLLEMVGVARRGDRDASGWRATTADGRWRVTLRPPESGADVATIVTGDGRLVMADWLFAMERT